MGNTYVIEGSFNQYLKDCKSTVVNRKSTIDILYNFIILISEPFSWYLSHKTNAETYMCFVVDG
jgi:hypothetical protein